MYRPPIKNSLRRNRFYLKRAARGALPPTLMGLVCFSFVSVAFGSAVYLAAVPSLVAQSPSVQAAGQALEESGVVEAFQDAAAQSAQAAAQAFSPASVAATLTGIDAAIASPEAETATPEGDSSADGDAPSTDAPSTDGGSTDVPGGSGDGDNPGGGDDAGDSGISDEQEAVYHASLVSSYNALSSYAERVNGMIATFNSTAVNGTPDERQLAFQECAQLFNDLSIAQGDASRLDVPAASRWYSAKEQVEALYTDLFNTVARFRRAWLNNVFVEDRETLVQHYNDWASPVIEVTDANGQITYLVDYAERLPQVAL